MDANTQRDAKLFIDWQAYPISNLAGHLENYLSVPIVDQTSLTGGYDIKLDWQQDGSAAGKAKLRQAVLDQLGLELVATNMPIEMLVVEKLK
jgi:uncharacterized protein (TIGR03435 family)